MIGPVALFILVPCLPCGAFLTTHSASINLQESFMPGLVESGSSIAVETSQAPTSGWHQFVTRPDLHPPRIRVEGSGSPGYIFFTPYAVVNIDVPDKMIGYFSLVIADSITGDVVWADTMKTIPTNLNLQNMLGEDVLVYWAGAIDSGNALTGSNYILDSSYAVKDRISVTPDPVSPLASPKWKTALDPHEVLIQDDASMIILITEFIPQNLSSYGGPEAGLVFASGVRKIDLLSREILFEWKAMEHIPLSESLFPILPGTGTQERPWDYIHINSLDIHPTDGSILMSVRHTETLYKINSTTGEIIWRLGGMRSDFTMGDGTEFHAQHHAHWLSDHEITLFDNQERLPTALDMQLKDSSFVLQSLFGFPTSGSWSRPASARAPSRGIILSLDFETMSCRLKKEYKHPDNPEVTFMGSMQVLPNGNALVGYGPLGYGAEFAANGTLLSTIRFSQEGASVASYRMLKYNWTSDPTTIPDIAIANDTLYMSWNGATEVKSWNIHAGRKPSQLDWMQHISKSSFETAASLPSGYGFFQVEALDSTNHSLAFSGVIRGDGLLLSGAVIQDYVSCNYYAFMLILVESLGLFVALMFLEFFNFRIIRPPRTSM